VALQPNPGSVPPDCLILDEEGNVASFRKVHVVLFNGHSTRAAGQEPWPAGGTRPPTNWGLSKPPHPFEIKAYEVV